MSKINVLAAATLGMLATIAYMPAFAYLTNPDVGEQGATQEQIKQCKALGIPEFACTQQQILAKERYIKANEEKAYGSGTAMFGKNFGEMGTFVGIIGALFGGVAAAFFARARVGKKISV